MCIKSTSKNNNIKYKLYLIALIGPLLLEGNRVGKNYMENAEFGYYGK